MPQFLEKGSRINQILGISNKKYLDVLALYLAKLGQFTTLKEFWNLSIQNPFGAPPSYDSKVSNKALMRLLCLLFLFLDSMHWIGFINACGFITQEQLYF